MTFSIEKAKSGIILFETYLNKNFIDKFSKVLSYSRETMTIKYGIIVAKYSYDRIKEYENCLEIAKQLDPLAKKLLDCHRQLESLMLKETDSPLIENITNSISGDYPIFISNYELLKLHIKRADFLLNCLLDDDLMINDLLQKTSRR